jgi:hypothetical protein
VNYGTKTIGGIPLLLALRRRHDRERAELIKRGARLDAANRAAERLIVRERFLALSRAHWAGHLVQPGVLRAGGDRRRGDPDGQRKASGRFLHDLRAVADERGGACAASYGCELPGDQFGDWPVGSGPVDGQRAGEGSEGAWCDCRPDTGGDAGFGGGTSD